MQEITIMTTIGSVRVGTPLPELPEHIKTLAGSPEELLSPSFWVGILNSMDDENRKLGNEVLKRCGYEPRKYIHWTKSERANMLAAHAHIGICEKFPEIAKADAVIEEIKKVGMTVDDEFREYALKMDNVAAAILPRAFVLRCPRCSQDRTIPAQHRSYCQECNPIFGNATTLGFEDLLETMPMPEPVFRECWHRGTTTTYDPFEGAEKILEGRLVGVGFVQAPTRDAVLDGLRTRWEQHLRRAYHRVKARRLNFGGTTTGRLSSTRPNLAINPPPIQSGSSDLMDGVMAQHRQLIEAAQRSKTTLQRVVALVHDGQTEEAHKLFAAEASLGLKHVGWDAVKDCLGDLLEAAESESSDEPAALAGGLKHRKLDATKDSVLKQIKCTTPLQRCALLGLIQDAVNRYSDDTSDDLYARMTGLDPEEFYNAARLRSAVEDMTEEHGVDVDAVLMTLWEAALATAPYHHLGALKQALHVVHKGKKAGSAAQEVVDEMIEEVRKEDPTSRLGTIHCEYKSWIRLGLIAISDHTEWKELSVRHSRLLSQRRKR